LASTRLKHLAKNDLVNNPGRGINACPLAYFLHSQDTKVNR
jgi:hypothetical protein